MKYIIGDCHGSFKTLMALIGKLPNNAELVFVGDLIDRGKNNRDIINFVRDNEHKCVLGNHEELMIDAIEKLEKYETPIWYSGWANNGGTETYSEYECKDDLLKDIEWMKNLPRYIVFDDVDKFGRKLIVSHAPCLDFFGDFLLDKDKVFKKYFNDLFVWNRKIPKSKQSEYFNVFGHNIISHFITNNSGQVIIDKEHITEDHIVIDLHCGYSAIDTGAFVNDSKDVFMGKLTALEFPSMRVIQQENIEETA